MFRRNETPKSGLQTVIDDLISEMAGHEGNTEDYAKCAAQLERLYKLKEIDKPERVKPDTLVIVAGNVLVTAVIVLVEQKSLITSKALSFLVKTK